MAGELIQIVTQRVSKCRLMVGENEWIECEGPGLVVYVSFINVTNDGGTSIDAVRLRKAVKSILNAKLASSSGWKSDHSDATSLMGLTDGPETAQLTIIPQATLAGKLVPGDKYLKYHRQVDKDRGFTLYSDLIKSFVDALVPSVVETPSTATGGQVTSEQAVVTWGSFGKRQGFEMVSSGPSTHYFEF